MKKNFTILFFTVFITVFVSISAYAAGTEIYTYDFESGWGDWYADMGVWEIGAPTAGPSTSYGGTQCAGTVIDGNYPSETDSRLISPSIQLDTISGSEELYLEFWHWFQYIYVDTGYVQIKAYDESTQAWSDWTNIGDAFINSSSVWTRTRIDLSSYAGQIVKIAFYHTTDSAWEEAGWYIDNIKIVRDVPVFSGNFENDWGDWYTDMGVWQIGAPSTGPGASYEGTQCAATVLDGNYPSETDSRLISPSIQLDTISGGEELYLQFWHWFQYIYVDAGYVQIKAYNELTQAWSDWTTIGDAFNNSSDVWTRTRIDLSSYAGQIVKIAFYHTADSAWEVAGWYIDDVQIGALVANAGADQTVTDSVTLDASQSYSQNSTIVSYTWTLTHRENASYSQTASGVSPTVSGLEPGFYDVMLTITDSNGNTSSDNCLVATTEATGGSCDGDLNNNGQVTIDEVQTVVNNYLHGCD